MNNPGMYTTPTKASINGLLQDLLIRQEQIDSSLRKLIDNLGPKERHAHSNTMFLVNMNTKCIKNLLDLVGCPQPTKPKSLDSPVIVVHVDKEQVAKQISIDV